MAHGIKVAIDPGDLETVHFEKEVQVPPTPAQLAWMLRNAERLAPLDGRRWRDLYARVVDNPERQRAMEKLDRGELKGLMPRLILEGASHADCLIECERAFIWVEGKRNDWLSPSTSWDVTRDQLARNLEAVWSVAHVKGKECCLIICHEGLLKYHEDLLVTGYRAGTWSGGWPHLDEEVRQALGVRIGTLTWSEIATEWSLVRHVPALSDLD